MAGMIDAARQAALRELLPVGADVDGQDGDGRSALWQAAHGGARVVVFLTEQPRVGAPRCTPQRATTVAAAIWRWFGGWPATAGRSPSRTTPGPPRSALPRSPAISAVQWLY